MERLKTLALSELRRVAERTRRRLVKVSEPRNNGAQEQWNSAISAQTSHIEEVVERVPWRVWYVAASNGDVIRGEECVTLAVYPDQGAFGARLVQFTASGRARRLRDCCILRADDFLLRAY